MDSFWKSKSVLVTGHTGFKGSWLSYWLLELGAEVHGISLPPENEPNLYEQLDLDLQVNCNFADICDGNHIDYLISEMQPDIVFHMAAQPLVRKSYLNPHQTWNTNVMGTLNVLLALQKLKKNCAAVVITTDKVYENKEWAHPYRENDRLGGNDPYSASKAATEILVSSWRRSFLTPPDKLQIITARAGNVIGGGDWAEDRLIPDLVRARSTGSKFLLRNPHSKRPWQHVLEPLSGYLRLARMLYDLKPVANAYNFGPNFIDTISTLDLIKEASIYWPGSLQIANKINQPHEAEVLSLSSEQARLDLNYMPRWDIKQAVKATMQWYRGVMIDGHSAKDLMKEQINLFGAP